MNWFERYGIVGTYFFLIIFVWIYSNGWIPLDVNRNYFGELMAIFAAAAVPIGYLWSVFSQRLYYLHKDGIQVHRQTAKELKEKNSSFGGFEFLDDEARLESEMSCIIRAPRKNNEDNGYDLGIEKIKYLMMFGTKRWDVISINSSLELCSYFLVVVFISTLVVKFFREAQPHYWIEIALIVFCLCVIRILGFSSKLLKRQVIDINKYAHLSSIDIEDAPKK